MIKVNPPNFLELLEEVLHEEKISRVKKDDYRHNPSSATMRMDDGKVVGACLRQLFYKAKNQPESDPKVLTVELQGLFGQGIHDVILSRLQKSKRIMIVPEAAGRTIVDPLTKEVSFRVDGLVTHKGELGVLEIKTMHSFALQKMVKENGPRASDLLQCLSYFGTNPAVLWTSLVYVGRDSAYRAEYHILNLDDGFYIEGIIPEERRKKLGEFSFDRIVARWKELEGYVERNELPPRDYKVVLSDDGRIKDERVKNGVKYQSAKACLYCSYLSHCWLNEINAKEDSVKISGLS